MIYVSTKIKLPITYEGALKRLKELDDAFRKANPELFGKASHPTNALPATGEAGTNMEDIR